MLTIFISGHLDLTAKEFNTHYRHPIDDFLLMPFVRFVVGDARGADRLAQEYLASRDASVTVYHMFSSPRNNVGGFKTVGSFSSDEARDTQMTYDSDLDIAWVRPGHEFCGTQKNLDRRKVLSKTQSYKVHRAAMLLKSLPFMR
jgi:hypothetical protein